MADTVIPPVGMDDDAALALIRGGDPQPVVEQPKPGAQAPAEAVPQGSEPEVAIDLTALKLQGVPQSVLDLIPKPALQEWSAQAKEREAKRATDFQQRAEEAKQAKTEAARLRDELGRFTSSKPETAAGTERKPTVDVDLDAELKPLVDELREAGVTTAGEKLSSILKRLSTAKAAEVEGLKTVNQQLAAEMGEFFVDQARAKLVEQYHQLSDDAIFEKVNEEAKARLQSGRYGDMPYRKAIVKAMEGAAREVLFDEIVKDQVDRARSNDSKRIAGQMTAPTRQPDKAPPTADDLDNQVIALIKAGKLDEAARLAR